MNLERFNDALVAVRKTGTNFTLRELMVVLALPYTGKGTPEYSTRHLAEMIGVNKPSISRAVTMLHKHGYVNRVEAKADRRQLVLRRTAKAEKLVQAIEKALTRNTHAKAA